jgi:hypothetical protein
MPAADVFIIVSYGYRTPGARKGYGCELAKSLQFIFKQGTHQGYSLLAGDIWPGYHL